MKSTSWFVAMVGAVMSVTTACGVFPDRPAQPAVHDFGLAEGFSSVSSSRAMALVWSNVTVTAPAWLQNENICYRLLYADPTRVRYYARDRWLAAPNALLAHRLSMAGGGGGWRLRIELLEFEQIFDSPQNARVILTFHALAQRSAEEDAVAEKIFRFSLPSPTADAQGAVTASVGLVDEAVKSLQNWATELSDRFR